MTHLFFFNQFKPQIKHHTIFQNITHTFKKNISINQKQQFYFLKTSFKIFRNHLNSERDTHTNFERNLIELYLEFKMFTFFIHLILIIYYKLFNILI